MSQTPASSPAPTFRAALVQPTSGTDVEANRAMVVDKIAEAKAGGADFVLFPEVVNLVEMGGKNLSQKSKLQSEDTSLPAFQQAARDNGVWVLIGSMVVTHETLDRKFANRSVLMNDQGDIVQTYDKIHMFDVDLEGGESYRESKNYAPGDQAALAETPWGPLGMTICYDIRFPHLYRHLAQAGARMISIPAAFTRPTGKAHWHTLLKARAIENGCFVLAPAQCGDHDDGRKTFGHSLIVDPWGDVLADGGEDIGIVYADLDMSRVDEARGRVPSLDHDRAFAAAQARSAHPQPEKKTA